MQPPIERCFSVVFLFLVYENKRPLSHGNSYKYWKYLGKYFDKIVQQLILYNLTEYGGTK